MTKFAILRKNKIVRHVVMIGENTNYKEKGIMDLVFDTEKKAIDVANVLTGKTKVVIYQEEKIKEAA